MITESPSAGDVPLVGDVVADVYVDPTDHSVVERAAADLAADVDRVTGRCPSVVHALDGSEVAVVVGTLGESDGVDGVAAVETESADRRTPGEHARWTTSDVPGRRTGSTMALDPPVFDSQDPSEAPTLEFDLDVPAGDATLTVYCLPTQALSADRDLRFAVTVGDERQVVSIDPDGGEHDPKWQGNVLRGAAVGTTSHAVDGSETLVLAGLDPGLVVDRIVVTVNGEDETYLGPRSTRG